MLPAGNILQWDILHLTSLTGLLCWTTMEGLTALECVCPLKLSNKAAYWRNNEGPTLDRLLDWNKGMSH